MLDRVGVGVWTRDLPVCIPTRVCVDESPYGADLLNLTSALTPASGAIAAGCWAALGAAVVLVAFGLRAQWRGTGLRPWAVLLPIALVVGGVGVMWSAGGWLGELVAVYGGADGLPSAPVPASSIGSWPLVQAAGLAALLLGGVALLLMLNTAAIREGRLRRSRAGR